jgi:transketolase
MKATRDGFGDQLAAMANIKTLVVLNADLADATRLKKFAAAAPNRYMEIGIAEANMIGIAAGLSEYGYKVVIPSFAAFITGRYDIIRCSLAYQNKPVLVVGTHAGMAIGKDGVTQMGLEDINLMRGLPNMNIIQPATYYEAMRATEYAINSDKLIYLRLGRQPVKEMFDEDCEFKFGKGQVCLEGSHITVISSGCTLEMAHNAATKMGASLINMPTLKPIDKDIIKIYARTSKLIVTVEDHTIVGGLGSAVAEVLAEAYNCSSQLLRIGIQDEFVESGPPADLYDKYGLTADSIVNQINRLSFSPESSNHSSLK